MMGRLAGKRMVITGSSRGLGRAFALACKREGADVVINGTNESALRELAAELAELGGGVAAVPGSVADSAVCTELVGECTERFGGIDVLVNNAGIVRDRTLLKMSDEEFDEVIAVDLRGPFLCTREAARAMKEQGGGHIIQVTSASGLVGNFGQANYAAAKAGMMGIMYTAVQELSRFDIRCNALWPIARTEMTQPVIDRAGVSARELGFGEPGDVAAGLVWLAGDSAGHLNGQCLSFNGYRTALWHSPAELHITSRDTAMGVGDLDEHYRDIEPPSIYRSER
jgi:3-oxoacyl-[acyl-carrier protein] reductase